MKFDAENFLTTVRGFKLSDLYTMEDQFDDLLGKCQSTTQTNLVQKKLDLVREVITEKYAGGTTTPAKSFAVEGLALARPKIETNALQFEE